MTYEKILDKYRKENQANDFKSNVFLKDVEKLKHLIEQHIKEEPDKHELLVPLSELSGINVQNFNVAHDWLVYELQCKCKLDQKHQILCIDLITKQPHGDDPITFLVTPFLSNILFWIVPPMLSTTSSFASIHSSSFSLRTLIIFMMQILFLLVASVSSYLFANNYYAAKFEFQNIFCKNEKFAIIPKVLLILQEIVTFITLGTGFEILLGTHPSDIFVIFCLTMFASVAFWIGGIIRIMKKHFEID